MQIELIEWHHRKQCQMIYTSAMYEKQTDKHKKVADAKRAVSIIIMLVSIDWGIYQSLTSRTRLLVKLPNI